MDSHVRRRRELDTHRPVRKHVRLHQLGLDRAEARRLLAIPPGFDDYVDSLVDNGVKVQVQLLYGNPMYTSPAGKLPDAIMPEPGGFHNPDRSLYSVYWPPKTPDQIAAFVKYVQFVVGHFRGRIHYYALWNEQDIDYWNPRAQSGGVRALC